MNLLKYLSFLLIFTSAYLCTAQNAWINEFHYDNTGADTGEFIEVVVEDAGSYDLNLLVVTLYDGSAFTVDASHTVSTFTTGDVVGDFTFYYKNIAGLENDAEGIALSYNGVLIQFISYEGSFTGSGGIANGIVSANIGVSESNTTTSSGHSLQLYGTGDEYDEFFWATPANDTPGALNNSQTLSSAPTITTTAPGGGYDFAIIPYGSSTVAVKAYSFIGANLSGDITITPPAEYKLSLLSDFSGTIYTDLSPLTLSPSGGTITKTVIYLKFIPPSASGATYSGNITHNSTGATDVSIAVTGDEGTIAWINEFHYDDNSTDANEYIEVIIKNNVNYDLSDLSNFTISLYDGATQKVYFSTDLSQFMEASTEGSYIFFIYNVTAENPIEGIQNGPNDGIALAYKGNLIQFISYEGILTAIDGPAQWVTSVDVGVSEPANAPEGTSIYLQNINLMDPGFVYSDFQWAYGGSLNDNTFGDVNNMQTLPIELTGFTGFAENHKVKLMWNTASETNNQYFTIEKSTDGYLFTEIGRVKSSGNGTQRHSYTFYDTELAPSAYYRLKQTDYNGTYSYSHVIKVEHTEHNSSGISIYPNPAGRASSLFIEGYKGNDPVKINAYDLRGVHLANYEGTLEEINPALSSLFEKSQTDFILFRVSCGSSVQLLKVVLNK